VNLLEDCLRRSITFIQTTSPEIDTHGTCHVVAPLVHFRGEPLAHEVVRRERKLLDSLAERGRQVTQLPVRGGMPVVRACALEARKRFGFAVRVLCSHGRGNYRFLLL
jgi:hypothetical protein